MPRTDTEERREMMSAPDPAPRPLDQGHAGHAERPRDGSRTASMRRAAPGLLAPAIALSAALVLGSGSVRAAARTVDISNFAFAPPTVTIKTGDSVTWTNSDPEQHTVTPDRAGAFKGSALIGTGGSYSVTFTTAGTFAYHCQVHPFMTGTVVVRGEDTKTPAPTSSPRPTVRPTPRATPRPTPTARPAQTTSPRPTATASPSRTPAPPPPQPSSTTAPSIAAASPATSPPASPAGGVAGATSAPGASPAPTTGPASPGSGGDVLPLAAGVVVVLAVLAGGTLLLRRSR